MQSGDRHLAGQIYLTGETPVSTSAVNRYRSLWLAMDRVKTKRNTVTKNGETFAHWSILSNLAIRLRQPEEYGYLNPTVRRDHLGYQPCMIERYRALVKLALEPEWEAFIKSKGKSQKSKGIKIRPTQFERRKLCLTFAFWPLTFDLNLVV